MTIEERANHKADISQYRSDYIYDRHSIKVGYIAGATEQKAIDDKAYANIIAEESNTSYESGLEEGRRVAINKACEWLKRDINSRNNLSYWKLNELPERLRKYMEEEKK